MTKFKRIYSKLMHRLPSKLPISVPELESFISDVLDVHELPDGATYKNAMAQAMMHLGPVTASKSKIFFAHSVRRRIANQAAYDYIQVLNEEEKKKLESKPEATPQMEPSDGPSPVQAIEAQVVS